MIFIYVTGTCISYIIVMTELIQLVVKGCGVDEDFVESITFRAIIGLPVTAFVFFPLSLMRDMGAF